MQFFRIGTRYLDPDVNAYVGMLGSVSRFNEQITSGSLDTVSESHFIGNWGADMGIVRGKHLWFVNMMGANLGSRLAFAPAIGGEHQLSSQWSLYHRFTLNFFIEDPIVDADQGLAWMPWKNVGFTLGYRLFTSKRIKRNGPRVGLLYRFDNPKIPFIFPSIG